MAEAPSVNKTARSSLDKRSDDHDDSDKSSVLSIRGKAYTQSRGVERMEALASAAKGARGYSIYIIIAVSLFVVAFASALEGSTAYAYAVYATSAFSAHSAGISATDVATSIISAVSKPFISKLADITSRPYTYIIIVAFYIIGFSVAAACKTLSAYIVGQVFITAGSSGIDILSTIINSDLVPLKWRGFGLGVLATPYLFTVWFAGLIVTDLSAPGKWRWGYGMWAIIIPCCIAPAVACLMYLERRANKEGRVNIASSAVARQHALEAAQARGDHVSHKIDAEVEAVKQDKSWFAMFWDGLIEIDIFGLILMGFGWSLLLLPFSLASGAKGGWKNPSLIAMMVIGAVILIFFAIYEWLWAPFPCMPLRMIKNKTFMTAVGIDFIYEVAGYLYLAYFSSYVYIVTDLNTTEWTYISNTLTLALCFFGLVGGALQRYYGRYKLIQIVGLSIKIVGLGILLQTGKGTTSVVTFAWVQLLIGGGGAFSVVASQVAAQASVPHQDVASSIAILSLWSNIGASIGSAIAGAVWGGLMPKYIAQEVPSLNATQVATYFDDITSIRLLDYDDPVRQGIIVAYQRVVYKLWVPALVLSFIPLIMAFFQTNYKLGDQQNAVTNTDTAGHKVDDVAEEEVQEKPTTLKGWLVYIWKY